MPFIDDFMRRDTLPGHRIAIIYATVQAHEHIKIRLYYFHAFGNRAYSTEPQTIYHVFDSPAIDTT
jgi:hypothetical protein